MSKRSSNTENKLDVPPMSRLFVICSRTNTEEEFRDEFGKFGTIEEVYMVKDRNSGEKKGVCYIKFSKTSEAAAALEAMNGKTLGSGERPIKVLVASSKSQGNKRYDDDEERYLRLFVIVPKETTENQLREEFGQFGRVDNISIVRDRQTKEGKGFAYIKFTKFTDIANAFENCAASYRAVFAEPKPPKNELLSNLSYDNLERGGRVGSAHYDNDRRMSDDFFIGGSSGAGPKNSQEGILTVICSPLLNQEHLWRLFDIIPGLDYCRIHEDYLGRTASATIIYNNLQSAVYAKEKLHGFEYPPGERLIIKYNFDAHNTTALGEQIFGLGNMGGGSNQGGSGRDSGRETFCNVPLPSIKQLAPSSSVCKKRLFIVCITQALPYTILKQAFCRFGDLIEVFLLPGKTCGYALYANEAAANEAIRTLHGAEICGIRMKVLEAEENTESRRKRLRPDEN